MTFNKENLKSVAKKPGVYIMKDIGAKVLYVGKAKNLKNRVLQYFQKNIDRPTLGLLTDKIESIDTIIVRNDKEALILENTLIKKYKPKYNILLKDDKTYSSICITTKHPWPMIKLVRLKKQPRDKNLYFGPYTNIKAARSIKDLLLSLFPLRQCSDSELINRTRPCILFEIKKCIAPCIDNCTKNEYNSLAQKAIDFLKGKDKTILNNLKKSMKSFSDNLEFERAKETLDIINQISHVMESQFVDTLVNKNTDVLGFFKKGNFLVITQLIFIKGRLTFSNHFTFSNIVSEDSDILESFILQNYIPKKAIPKEIIVPIDLDTKNISYILSETTKIKPNILFPKKGKKIELINLANENAKIILKNELASKQINEKNLMALKETLNLKNYPKKIVCFDTSSFSDKDKVASMVTYLDGIKDKKNQRIFKIKTEKKGDVNYMREALFRYFSKLKEIDKIGRAHV